MALTGLLLTFTSFVSLIFGIFRFLWRTWKLKQRKAWPPDTVIIHQVARGPYAPSLSPFPIKLETFLRITQIPYQTDFTSQRSSKGKIPWITYNGVDIADSQFSIEFCKQEFNVDINKHLSENEKALAHAYRILIEDHLYWSMCAEIFGSDSSTLHRLLPYGPIKRHVTAWILRLVIQIELWGHGMGRHNMEEIRALGRADLEALSTLLADKDFMLGEEPCELDCVAFGMLSLCKWHMFDSSHQKWVQEDFSNLSEFCDRMKARYWPDWNDVITFGGKQIPKR